MPLEVSDAFKHPGPGRDKVLQQYAQCGYDKDCPAKCIVYNCWVYICVAPTAGSDR